MLPFEPLPGAVEVLYVEDQDVHVTLMRALFERRLPSVGLRVAGDLRSALALAPTLHPALLLLDINLPDGDGVALLERLRAMDHLRRVPAIAVTAEPRFDAARTGFEEAWRKPIHLQRTLERLDHWLPARAVFAPGLAAAEAAARAAMPAR